MQTRFVKRSVSLAAIGAAALGANLQKAEAAIQVDLNGQPLATSVAPVQIHQRTMIPMRDIFEALGASVDWSDLTQSVTAHKDLTTVNLQINNRMATVNDRRILLDQPAILWGGRTMVPLRFVSEALGAQVTWNDALQTVSIIAPLATPGSGTTLAAAPFYNPPVYNPAPVIVNPAPVIVNPAPVYPNPAPVYNAPPQIAANDPAFGQEVRGVRTISVPGNVVVPVTLDQTLSSASARVGQRFTATVTSQRLGDSEFPAGSKAEGTIVEARPRTSDQPGVLDLDFQNVILPDGTRVPLRGELIGLDNSNVMPTSQGRIVARSAPARNTRNKSVLIGAGAGYVIGHLLLKQNGLLSGVLGAAGGYILGQKQDKPRTADAVIAAGTRLGVRLDDPVSYADTTGYGNYRTTYLRM